MSYPWLSRVYALTEFIRNSHKILILLLYKPITNKSLSLKNIIYNLFLIFGSAFIIC